MLTEQQRERNKLYMREYRKRSAWQKHKKANTERMRQFRSDHQREQEDYRHDYYINVALPRMCKENP